MRALGPLELHMVEITLDNVATQKTFDLRNEVDRRGLHKEGPDGRVLLHNDMLQLVSHPKVTPCYSCKWLISSCCQVIRDLMREEEERQAAVYASSGPATVKAIKKCAVCKDAESKYVCPKCSDPYCSLACYKLHNGSCTTKFQETTEKDAADTADAKEALSEKKETCMAFKTEGPI